MTVNVDTGCHVVCGASGGGLVDCRRVVTSPLLNAVSFVEHTVNSRPLWQRQIPRYPLYYKGNPQLRIYLPLFWMKLLKWDKDLPSDTQSFEVHLQMTEHDVKNYLERIYKVKVLTVTTKLLKGESRKHPMFGYSIQPAVDRRIAFVQLSDSSFKFPDISFKNALDNFDDSKLKSGSQETFPTTLKDICNNDLPTWFNN
ncbi:hypothetical protein HELRODRAFT_173066 [Helobdella robusta]|uniref:Large ribosomal subunit protein uL23m n=1 Tax=Helobdella robusta TaxID=6412 RepID=T1F6B3_HELRO|nr:hypothetical protein HELRODRAFT_173066 [Helobdella robusta]ESO04010.1 hypothetical protein HELRODRAFT_173066 [Helobdella robusta]